MWRRMRPLWTTAFPPRFPLMTTFLPKLDGYSDAMREDIKCQLTNAKVVTVEQWIDLATVDRRTIVGVAVANGLNELTVGYRYPEVTFDESHVRDDVLIDGPLVHAGFGRVFEAVSHWETNLNLSTRTPQLFLRIDGLPRRVKRSAEYFFETSIQLFSGGLAGRGIDPHLPCDAQHPDWFVGVYLLEAARYDMQPRLRLTAPRQPVNAQKQLRCASNQIQVRFPVTHGFEDPAKPCMDQWPVNQNVVTHVFVVESDLGLPIPNC